MVLEDVSRVLPIAKLVLRLSSSAVYEDDDLGDVEMFLVAEVYNLFIVATIVCLFICTQRVC